MLITKIDDNNIHIVHKLVKELIVEVDKICTQNNITYSLAYGSVLGAVRHHGFIPWDSDMDIIISVDDVDTFRQACCKGLPNNMKIYMWDKEENYHPCFDRIAFIDQPHELVHVDIYQMCGLPNDVKKKEYFIKKCFYAYHILSCKLKNTDYSRKRNVWKVNLIKFLLLPVSKQRIRKIYKAIYHKYPFSTAKEVYAITSIYQLNDYMIKEDLFDTCRVKFEDIELPIPKKAHEYLSHIYGDYMTPKKYE